MQPKCLVFLTQLTQLKDDQYVFKIFGHQTFNFDKAYATSSVDWSAFYTQLNPEHSLRYLTKKWDDGADYACLVLLQPLKNIRLLKILNKQFFSDPKLSGEQKANALKKDLKNKSQYNDDYKDLNLQDQDIFLKSLGQKQTLLQCVDRQENEIIIPHEMLNERNFKYQILIIFKKSNDGLLRTIGWRKHNQLINNEKIWIPIKGQSVYQPHFLLKQSLQIQQILSKFDHRLLNFNN